MLCVLIELLIGIKMHLPYVIIFVKKSLKDVLYIKA